MEEETNAQPLEFYAKAALKEDILEILKPSGLIAGSTTLLWEAVMSGGGDVLGVEVDPTTASSLKGMSEDAKGWFNLDESGELVFVPN